MKNPGEQPKRAAEEIAAIMESLRQKFETPRPCNECGQEFAGLRCPACSMAQQSAEDEMAARAQADKFAQACPPLYQETIPSQLPNPNKLIDVMAWQYGRTGLILSGKTRTGKTRCMWLLIRRLFDEGLKVIIKKPSEFSHGCTHAYGNGYGDRWFNEMAKADVLFIDDLGKWKFTERLAMTFFDLIETRISNLKPILSTTNDTGETLIAKMGDIGGPVVMRLREACKVIQFK